jgi:hypothetical protein
VIKEGDQLYFLMVQENDFDRTYNIGGNCKASEILKAFIKDRLA